MKKYLIILFSVIALIGCAKIAEVKKDVTACYDDPICFNKELERSKEAGYKAGQLAGLSGVPWAEKVATPLIGYVSLIFGLAQSGHLINKIKKETSPS